MHNLGNNRLDLNSHQANVTRVNLQQQAKALRASVTPASMLVSLQTHSGQPARSLLELGHDAENSFLAWAAAQVNVVKEVEDGIASASNDEALAALDDFLAFLDQTIEEDCVVAQLIQNHFSRAEKLVEPIAKTEAKEFRALGKRVFSLAKQQIDVLMNVADNLRALRFYYAPASEKERLSEQHQDAVSRALHRFLIDEKHPSLKFEKLAVNKHSEFYCIRVSRDCRIVLSRIAGNEYELCDVGGHEVYRRLNRR